MNNTYNIILADGRFPSNEVPLYYLNHAAKIVCCDGAVLKLLKHGLEPDVIVGDMDSIVPELKEQFADIIHQDKDQESNDLTKAVNYCVNQGMKDLVILGATGLREDHAIGNISLLAQYAQKANVKLVTNYGTFTAISESTTFKSFECQQVSIFTLDTDVQVTSTQLKFPLTEVNFDAWWKGTLNEALSNQFTLDFKTGKRLVVFQTHLPK